jgi:hypothetical protein
MNNTLKTGLLLPVAAFIFGFTLVPQKEDSYKVIKVNGNITVKKTGKPLLQGDVFQESTMLDFSSDAKATVINAEKGRFILTPKTAGSRSNLIPAINNISSRSGAIINIIDLQNHFKGDVCVIERTAIKIASKDYAMSPDNFFYLEYFYKGEKINKKMSYAGDSLVIDRAELYKVDGSTIPSPDTKEVTLYYRNSKENKSYNISTFNLVFPDNDELKKEVNIILDEIKTKPNTNKVDEVMSYLTEFYGKPSKDNVKGWMKKYYKI